MTSEQIRQRSDLLGTQVITRTTGKRLGVVSQLWVDIDRREVVALSLRPNLLYGTPQPMFLNRIRQIGDVILVDDENVIEDIDVEAYNSLINCEVITETGELLGKVRGFKFDVDNGKVDALIIASIGLPLIPDQVVSTYELPIDEVVSSGPDRLIVFEGAEERLNQITVGVLERLGIGRPPWERDEEEDYVIPTRTENQLGTGLRTPVAPPMRTPVIEETWDDDNWEEARPQPRQLRQRQPEPTYYEDEEEDNWRESSPPARYEKRDRYDDDDYDDDYDDVPKADYQEIEPPRAEYKDDKYSDIEEDAWADDEATPYTPPKINIPEKTKAPEYEEEGY
jgi:sporulation protein YlmC with PRC-barrel domain